VSQEPTCRTGFVSASAFVAVSEGAGWLQQSIGAPELMQGPPPMSHDPIDEELCAGIRDIWIIAAGTHVSTADARNAAATNSATTPARRLRTIAIVNRPTSLVSTNFMCRDELNLRCHAGPFPVPELHLCFSSISE